MLEITSKEDWWSKVGLSWDKLEKIILRYYPNQSDFPEEGWPLPYPKLENPQRACNVVIKKLREEKPIWSEKGSFKNYVNKLKENRDVKLAEILNDTWFGLPETPSIRNLPGFFVFCDLCSEACVLFEEEKLTGILNNPKEGVK